MIEDITRKEDLNLFIDKVEKDFDNQDKKYYEIGKKFKLYRGQEDAN
jgi:hypothetical protein